MSLGIPLGALYTYYRVRQLCSEERLAAIAKGVSVPMEPELTQAARSRRAGILLTCGAVGFMASSLKSSTSPTRGPQRPSASSLWPLASATSSISR
jgi:hypothetical protein